MCIFGDNRRNVCTFIHNFSHKNPTHFELASQYYYAGLPNYSAFVYDPSI